MVTETGEQEDTSRTTQEEGKDASTKKKLMKLVQLEQNLRNMSDEIDSSSLESILEEVKNDISDIIGAERITIYMVNEEANEIYSRVFDGDEVQEIRMPISCRSVAGFVAEKNEPALIENVYDEEELKEIHPDLSFDRTWDQRTGVTTREMLAVPLERNGTLHGVIQAINKKDDGPFEEGDLRMVNDLCSTLALALEIRKRIQSRKSRWNYLLKNNVIDPEDLDKARSISNEEDISIETVLIDEFGVDREEIGASLEDYYRYQYIPFDPERPIPVELIEDLDLSLLKHNLWVPLEEQEEDRALVLMANPKDIQTRDDIEAWYGGDVRYAVSTREEVLSYIDFFFGLDEEEADGDESGEDTGAKGSGSAPDTRIFENSIDDILEDLSEEELVAGMDQTQDEEEEKDPEEVSEDDSAVVRLVNQIIVQAYKQGASDIHFETNPDDDVRVRFRVDGICKDYRTLPRHFGPALVSRMKIMAQLDIAERRMPQDGKIKFKNYGPLDIELRMATMPTQGSVEDVVLRILSGSDFMTVEDIGMREEVHEQFMDIIQNPHGIILCVGPTGSGKTTTLHAALHHLNQPEVKICTAENPVEITQDGLRQLQVQPKIGLSFSRAMKCFLRSDPDIIMVGEMRDLDTTSTAIEASLTGHLVFSTLHTNSAPETLTRLLNMDIDPYSFGDALRGVLAQRLVRTFCDKCREEVELTEEQWEKYKSEFDNEERFHELAPDPETVQLYQPVGCEHCNDTGYKGRMAIHELLVSSDRVKELIYESARAEKINRVGQEEGMLTLKQDGILKVLEGHTDLSEVNRVCIG